MMSAGGKPGVGDADDALVVGRPGTSRRTAALDLVNEGEDAAGRLAPVHCQTQGIRKPNWR